MNADRIITRSSPVISKASCLAAGLSVLPVLWLFLVVTPSNNAIAPLAFFLSVPLAVAAFVLGLIGLFVDRRYMYSISGVVLSGVVLLFWGFLLLLAVVTAMIALP
ncbi:MAG: hypothetical protein WCJ09_16770 [Planctomycetota bacterium]